MNGEELTARLITDLEKSIAARHRISDYEEIKNCVDGVRNFINAGSIFQKFSIAHTYDCQLRFDAMRLSFFLNTNPHIKNRIGYHPGESADLPELLVVLHEEKDDVARRFDVFRTCSEIDRELAYRYCGLVHLLNSIHDMAGTISESLKQLA